MSTVNTPIDTAVVRAALDEAAQALDGLRRNDEALAAVARAASLLADAFAAGRKAMSCGNGGSMCDAMHFAEELSGRFRDDRPAYPAVAISDVTHMSCVGNDYGFERVFARFVEAHGQPGDVLLAITTSGTSRNVVAAAEVAKARGVRVIALTGNRGSPLEALADVAIVTPGGRYADRVQELHIKVIHILIELVEGHLAGAAAQR
ncbi:MAG TPA: D-sedoheptulose 7-phosphate isomerase [Casimicrobiaceae bacterium]|jgi:D-sedoheptulose 7-phosphate isomerase|nr:D-sedoheptulose 7-phosphate isomerase [Casimicrobiaceae bacterium]